MNTCDGQQWLSVLCVQAEVRQMLVRDGLLQPLLQALRIPGLNRKSVTILSYMAKVLPSCSTALWCFSLLFRV